MNRVLEQQALAQIPEMLAHWLDLKPAQLRPGPKGKEVDLILWTASHNFVIEWKGAGNVHINGNPSGVFQRVED
jgi:hypothetical protein